MANVSAALFGLQVSQYPAFFECPVFLYILVTSLGLCDLLIQTCLQWRQIGQITAFNSLTSSLNQRVHLYIREVMKHAVKYFPIFVKH